MPKRLCHHWGLSKPFISFTMKSKGCSLNRVRLAVTALSYTHLTVRNKKASYGIVLKFITWKGTFKIIFPKWYLLWSSNKQNEVPPLLCNTPLPPFLICNHRPFWDGLVQPSNFRSSQSQGGSRLHWISWLCPADLRWEAKGIESWPQILSCVTVTFLSFNNNISLCLSTTIFYTYSNICIFNMTNVKLIIKIH